MNPESDSLSFYEKSGFLKIFIGGLCVAAVLLVAAEFAYDHEHAHSELERSFAFQCWLGFVSFVVAVMLGRFLRLFVRRPPDYYDVQHDLGQTMVGAVTDQADGDSHGNPNGNAHGGSDGHH